MNKLIHCLIMLSGVLISAFAQVLLKKSAIKSRKSFLEHCLNLRILLAYSIFIVATLCTIVAYRVIPLSLGPVLASTEYVFVAALDRLFFSKRISGLTATGLFVIVLGIVVSAI